MFFQEVHFMFLSLLISLTLAQTTVTQNLDVYVDPARAYDPWGVTEGLLQFRGNPQRNWYGTGPLATNYEVAWRYPDNPMCATSDGKTWCGSGWTGQPAIWRRPDGRMEVIVGTYDRSVHFIDFATGQELRKPFKTGDIIKGSVTIDPNGFPLLYFGSRDNKYRILSLQGDEAVEIWSLDAKQDVPRTIWNNDWDGNSSVVNDHLLFGGENGWFYVWKLNRAMVNNQVTVSPEIRVRMEGWTDTLLRNTGDRNASIESSVVMYKNRVYFTNSGGRIVGLDLSEVDEDLQAKIVFDFWAGDDIDASPVVDEDGMLYVAIEYERFLEQARNVGQLIKLNPYNPENPLVWKLDVRDGNRTVGGLWATPALYKETLYASTHSGHLLIVNTQSGEVLNEMEIGFHAWSSPAIINDRLLVGTCSPGGFKVYDLQDKKNVRELYSYNLKSGGCIESTPAVWNGSIVVGSRDGHIYKFSEVPRTTSAQ
jgi:hypothetical protein